MERRCFKKINLRYVYWIRQTWEVGQAKQTGRAMEKVIMERRKTSWR
jgi:hypothetical protein